MVTLRNYRFVRDNSSIYGGTIPQCGMEDRKLTTIQISTKTRDRLYWLKFRKTYDEFLGELMDLFVEVKGDELGFKP